MALFNDDLNEQCTEGRDQFVRPESVLVGGCGPPWGGSEEVSLCVAGLGDSHAFGALLLVGLTSAVVTVKQFVAPPLDYIEPQGARLGGPNRDEVGFR